MPDWPSPTSSLSTCTGKINIDNLGGDYPMLAGNLTAICSSLIICLIGGFWKPQNYDWKSTREIPTIDEAGVHHAPSGKRLPQPISLASRAAAFLPACIQSSAPCCSCHGLALARLFVDVLPSVCLQEYFLDAAAAYGARPSRVSPFCLQERTAQRQWTMLARSCCGWGGASPSPSSLCGPCLPSLPASSARFVAVLLTLLLRPAHLVSSDFQFCRALKPLRLSPALPFAVSVLA